MQHPVAARLNLLIEELSEMFPERRKVIEAAVLAILAKQHFFALGPPGVAKSTLFRCLFSAVPDAPYFETLLSKNRPPEAVLGPISLKRLRDDDLFLHAIQGYLPTATFALLDELGKMSPTLGHDLLPVLNERVFHQVDPMNGTSYIDVPLYTAGAASNEVPTDGENSDAAALWDRILVRMQVEDLVESSNWLKMLKGKVGTPKTLIAWADLKDVIDNDVPAVSIDGIDDQLVALRAAVMAADLKVSGRRWKQSMPLLQASAFLAGRTQITVTDLSVLRHTLWDDPADINAVERLTIGVADPIARQALDLLDKIEEVSQAVRDKKGLSREKRAAESVDLNSNLAVVARSISDLLAQAQSQGSSTTKIKEVQDRARAVQNSIWTDLMGMDLSMMPTPA